MADLHATTSISVDALPAMGWPSVAGATAVDYRTAIHPQNLCLCSVWRHPDHRIPGIILQPKC